MAHYFPDVATVDSPCDAIELALTISSVPPQRLDLRLPTKSEIKGVIQRSCNQVGSTLGRAVVQVLMETCALTPDDVCVLAAYTLEAPYPLYSLVNGWLQADRTAPMVRHHIGPYFAMLFRAMAKLPRTTERATRGVKVHDAPALCRSFDNYLTEFAAGTSLTFWGLSSFSLEDSVATNSVFAGTATQRSIIYTCAAVECVSLAPFSVVGDTEHEVVPLPPATFTVLNAVRVDNRVVVCLQHERQQKAPAGNGVLDVDLHTSNKNEPPVAPSMAPVPVTASNGVSRCLRCCSITARVLQHLPICLSCATANVSRLRAAVAAMPLDEPIRFSAVLNTDFHELSNVYPAEVVMENQTYPTSEHYYQAAKFLQTAPFIAGTIRLTADVDQMLSIAQQWNQLTRRDWATAEGQTIASVLAAKFNHAYLRDVLALTGTRQLVQVDSDTRGPVAKIEAWLQHLRALNSAVPSTPSASFALPPSGATLFSSSSPMHAYSTPMSTPARFSASLPVGLMSPPPQMPPQMSPQMPPRMPPRMPPQMPPITNSWSPPPPSTNVVTTPKSQPASPSRTCEQCRTAPVASRLRLCSLCALSHSSRLFDALRLMQPEAPVNFYHQEGNFFEFSTFYLVDIAYYGKVYPSAEHCFQAARFLQRAPALAEQIRTTERPRQAMSIAFENESATIADWRHRQNIVMKEVLVEKFRHPFLRELLLATGNRRLCFHTSTDKYWGDGGDGTGVNQLGETLMSLRSQLRNGST
jgi:ribA/ribD-fused uncharacterized protein